MLRDEKKVEKLVLKNKPPRSATGAYKHQGLRGIRAPRQAAKSKGMVSRESGGPLSKGGKRKRIDKKTTLPPTIATSNEGIRIERARRKGGGDM